MELAIEQHCEEKSKVQTKMENVLQENDRLLTQALSVEIEKVLVITALKEQLDKLKGKAVLTEAVSLNPIDPELLKVDVTPAVLKLRKNRTTHIDYIRHTQGEAATLRKIVESERLQSPLNTSLDYACKYTRRIQELLMILQQTCPYLTNIGTKLETVIPKNPTKQIRLTAQVNKLESITVTTLPSTNLESNKPVISSTGVNLVSSASGSMSQDNTKNNRIHQTQKKAKKNKVEDHLRTVKSSLNKASVVDSKATSYVLNSVSNLNSDLKCASSNRCLLSDNHDTCVGRTFTLVGNVCLLTRIATPTIVPPREPIPIVNKTDKPVVTMVIRIVLWYLDSGCSKYITGDRSQLVNFVQMFLGTVKFGNDHVAKIMGYGDYQIGNVTISWQNGVVERRNRTLIEAARTMLIYAQAPLFLWAEAVATACFTQNRSIIRLRHGKTPYELLHNKLPDLSFFHVFGALCYPTNDSENLGKLQPKADIEIFIGYALTKKAFRIYNRRTRRIVETIHVDFDELTAMASEQRSSGPALNEMTHGTISSGFVHTTSPSISYVPPSRNDWGLLFQPMFDELLNPPPSVVNQALEAIAPLVEVIPPVNTDSTGSPSSTTVEQDAPSTSNST
nr:retrovirus-related Pol polyprotein from transposon TNT 1-94 [Tanacetum cinerariifolium]